MKCSKCISKKTEFLNCLYVEELLESDSETIFENWPFLNDPVILEKFKEITSRISEVDQIKDKIRTIFKNLRIKIDSKLEEKQEEIFQFIDSQKKAQQKYNQICQKEKLDDIIRNQHQDFEKQNLMIKEIIAENNLNYEKNKQTLLYYINSFQEIINIDLSAYDKIENSLCQAIDNQNWQPQKENLLKFQSQIQNSEPQEQEQVIVNENNLSEEINKQNIQQLRNEPFKVKNLNDLSDCLDKNEIDFDFSQQILDTQGILKLTSTLQKCKNVVSLSLNLQNQFQVGVDFLKGILSELENCQNITSLNLNLQGLFKETNAFGCNYDLSNQNFIACVSNIANVLKKLKNMTKLNLNLSEICIGIDGLKIILDALQNCQTVIELKLDISNCFLRNVSNNGSLFQQPIDPKYQNKGFSQQIALELANTLLMLQNMSDLSLDLSQNFIGDAQIQTIACALQKFTKVTSLNLNLSENQISPNGITQITDALKNSKNISNLNLNLSYNMLMEENAKNILKKLENCQQFTKLEISLTQNHQPSLFRY
ncbi:hypothetical protein ABPG74_006649 [Tetrahymena malaccensis]